ncbi:hypothetical protein FRC01_003466 [Tulasnella sp. 417]|nr:hypothetical protein FRC01_003466 [Tulasnella sp. 417]
MKLLAILIVLLSFGPTILDHSLGGGGNVIAPTPVYPTKTYDPSKVINAGKVILDVVATPATRLDHNNAEVSGLTISVSTGRAVANCNAVEDIGVLSRCTKANSRPHQNSGSDGQRWWQIDSTWAVNQTSSVCELLLPILIVGLGLLLGQTLYQSDLTSQGAVGPNAVNPQVTVKCRASSQAVVRKQPGRPVPCITIYLGEAAMGIYPYPNNSGSGGLQVGKWPVLVHPRQNPTSTPYPAHLCARVVIDGRLFNVRLHGISSYHPWAPHIARSFNVPWEVVKKPDHVDADATIEDSALPARESLRTITNFESKALVALDLAGISSDTSVIDEVKQYTQTTRATAPQPPRPASVGSNPRSEAPSSEAPGLVLPNPRSGTWCPEAILDFNRPLSTDQYISWLYLTRREPLPYRPVTVERAVEVRDELRPTLRNLAARAKERHPEPKVGVESGKGQIEKEELGAPVPAEDQPEIRATEEETVDQVMHGHCGGARAARKRRQVARKAGLSN